MDKDQLILTITLTLAAIAMVQMLYLAWLNYTDKETSNKRQRPSSPIMPTSPDGIPTHHGGTDGGQPLPGNSMGKMVILRGIAASTMAEIPLPSNNFTIGRFFNPESNILVALDERSISRRHAEFVSDEATREYYLTDTHSSYGTRLQVGNDLEPFVPGKGHRLYNEDVVQFGNLVTVRFVLPCSTRPAKTRLY